MRSASRSLVLALVLSTAACLVGAATVAGASSRDAASPATPIIYGYPYAAACPFAGLAKKVDQFAMYECNCTSYVAWALAANHKDTGWFIAGAMDAWNWPHVARLAGLPVTTQPIVGDVATWPYLGRLGHVALVTSVSRNGRFSVAEYNQPGPAVNRFEFDVRNNVSPDGVQFIHVPRRPAGESPTTKMT